MWDVFSFTAVPEPLDSGARVWDPVLHAESLVSPVVSVCEAGPPRASSFLLSDKAVAPDRSASSESWMRFQGEASAFLTPANVARFTLPPTPQKSLQHKVDVLHSWDFRVHPWESRRTRWLPFAEALTTVVDFVSESGSFGIAVAYDPDVDVKLLARAHASLKYFSASLVHAVRSWAEDFATRIETRGRDIAVSPDAYGEFLRFREFVFYFDRQAAVPAGFGWSEAKSGPKRLWHLVEETLTQETLHAFDRFERQRLSLACGFDWDAAGSQTLSEAWQTLSRELSEIGGASSAVTAYFSPAEQDAFRLKIAQWGLANSKLGQMALTMYREFASPATKARFLKLLVCLDRDNFVFFLTKLFVYRAKMAELDTFIGDAAVEYAWAYERCQKPRGYRFELEALDAFSGKPGIVVQNFGAFVPTSFAGGKQQVDLRIRVTNPDNASESGVILVELFAGKGTGEKDRQLENYVSAAQRFKAGVLFVNGNEEVRPQTVETSEGKTIARLSLKQIQTMHPELLQRKLWDIYREFHRLYGKKEKSHSRRK